MKDFPQPLDLSKVKVFPLAKRRSLSVLEDILVDPEKQPPRASTSAEHAVRDCAEQIRKARRQSASVMLIFGAHLVKNGGQLILRDLMRDGWLTHLATNGAGVIHDWELAFQARTEESVRENVPTGTFGTWDETGRSIQLALLSGGLHGEGFGRSLGRYIVEDGLTLPSVEELETSLRDDPKHPFSSARADLLQVMVQHGLASGHVKVAHPNKASSILANAFEQRVPYSIHPGIGYDIFVTHPLFSGAATGRAGAEDFRLFTRAVEGLDGGVVLSVGSAIMGPQVFEKSLSCVNNLRLQTGRPVVSGHTIYVVDIQDGGKWDWSDGEPPKDNPAYYLRFCKSYARMGGEMKYVQCDNVAFLHNLLHQLRNKTK